LNLARNRQEIDPRHEQMITFASISCPYSSDNGRAKLFTELGCRLLVQMVCQRLSSMKISHSSQQHELTTRDVFLQTRSDLWQSHWLTRTQFAGADMQLQPMTRTCVCCDQHIMQQTWAECFFYMQINIPTQKQKLQISAFTNRCTATAEMPKG